MTMEQQKDILDHTFDLLTKFNNGIPPKGSVAPWWETSKEGTNLLLDKGIEYGSQFFKYDCAFSFGHAKFDTQIILTWLTSAFRIVVQPF